MPIVCFTVRIDTKSKLVSHTTPSFYAAIATCFGFSVAQNELDSGLNWTPYCLYGDLTTCFYGAPGEIRTPDLVVRSHALENALNAINTGISLLRLSQTILSFREFYYYF